MASIHLKHPVHGEKIAYSDVEAKYDQEHGWVVVDQDAAEDAAGEGSGSPDPELAAELEQVKGERDELAADLDKAKAELEKVKGDLKEAKHDLKEAKAELKALKAGGPAAPAPAPAPSSTPVIPPFLTGDKPQG